MSREKKRKLEEQDERGELKKKRVREIRKMREKGNDEKRKSK